MMNAWWKRTFSPRVYLDYAAATPLSPAVARAMAPYFSRIFANPSAIHAEGRAAHAALADARSAVADLLRIRPAEVTFVSGGTEANNLALVGAVDAAYAASRAYGDIEIITTPVEHPSILATLEALSARGVVVTYVSVDADGRVDCTELRRLVSERTLLVSVAYINSEVGTIENVKRVARTVRSCATDGAPYVHVDASQAPLWMPLAMDSLGVELMTLDAGKCYGPKGAGVLAHRRRVPLVPLVHGGDQEAGLRAGTENVALAVGCATALRRAQEGYRTRSTRVRALREYCIDLLLDIPGVVLNGPRDGRAPNNVNVSIPGLDGEYAVVVLDTHGIAASTRSACAGSGGGSSHVVAALTGDEKRAASTIRFTLGEQTTRRGLRRAARALAEHVAHMRASLSTDAVSGVDIDSV